MYNTDLNICTEKMNKKFSKDLTAKGRVVWIVPQTKSIHW